MRCAFFTTKQASIYLESREPNRAGLLAGANGAGGELCRTLLSASLVDPHSDTKSTRNYDPIRHRLFLGNRGIRRGVETFRGRVNAWVFANVA